MKEATSRWFAIATVAAVSFGMAGCSAAPREAGDSGTVAEAADDAASAEGEAEHASAEAAGESTASREGAGEHARAERGGEHGEGGEGGEHGSEGEGEESGEYIGRGETWDKTRRGAKLVLSFDPAANAFVGTVENTAQQTLCAVRVEVHLSSGTELGPTERDGAHGSSARRNDRRAVADGGRGFRYLDCPSGSLAL